MAEYLSSNCSSFDFPALRAFLESPRCANVHNHRSLILTAPPSQSVKMFNVCGSSLLVQSCCGGTMPGGLGMVLHTRPWWARTSAHIRCTLCLSGQQDAALQYP